MTDTDKETGLPIVGAEQAGQKSIPIDPKLLPELRTLEEARGKSMQAASFVGTQLVQMIATAASVGQKAFIDEKAWREKVTKLAALHGIPDGVMVGTDLEKGLLIV